MPAFATHYSFLEEMSEYAKNHADFNFNLEAASIGAQGPDIFFFHKILNRIKSKSKIGSALHRAKPAELFEAFAEYCKFSPNIDIAKSYIYGFIMHYALDRKCHPFVYAWQEKILSNNSKLHPSAAHNRIEMAMDTYFINKKIGITEASAFDSASTITSNIEIIEEIAHLLKFVITKITHYSITEKEIEQAIYDTKKTQKILQDKNGTLRPALRITESILAPFIKYFKFSSMIKPKDLEKAKKYGNINNSIWISPYSKEESYASFEDLYNSAINDAELLILGFNKLCLGYSNGYEITHNISFLTGIEVK